MLASMWLQGRGTNRAEETVRLRSILKKVSRSFYLSLIVLPKPVRTQMGLAYLFCRAADTIADTPILPHHERLSALHTFRTRFQENPPSRIGANQLQRMVQYQPPRGSEGERQLLLHLHDCFRAYERLASGDQRLVKNLVLTLTQGMEMDLTCFPGDAPAGLSALPDRASLDRYTYYVAGVVGEFWTMLCRANLRAFRNSPDSQRLSDLGKRFGQGLQLTNILKDVGKDLQRGRCYLPEDELQQLGLQARDLLDSTLLPQVRPLIVSLIEHALEHLDHGSRYVRLLPRRALRVRLSCMWPLLFAVQTLGEVCRSQALLSPQEQVKISRQAVYCTMLRSLWYLVVPSSLARYYASRRQRLTHALS
jgi:farnesyl-diphosphate farnesyltransferase